MKSDARFYEVPGVGRLPSVTTILQVISKPALMNWAAKQGTHKAKIIMDKLLRMSPLLHDSMLGELGPEFFKDGNAQATEAADYGTQAHSVIERVLKGELTQEEAILKAGAEPVEKAVVAFLSWWNANDFEVVKSESMVYSKTFNYAGTADVILRGRDGIILGDFKTSRAIWPEYKLQTVAYKYAAEEMTGEKIERVMIYRFGKDGGFEDYEVPNIQHPDLLDRFIDAKRLWTWQHQENMTFSSQSHAEK